MELYAILCEHVKSHSLGTLYVEVDTVFGNDEVRAPDIQLFSKNICDKDLKSRADILPMLCIEILSPSSGRMDRVDNFKLYQSREIAHYWIVDSEQRTIEAYSFEGRGYIASGRGGDILIVRLPPFPALDIPLSQLWQS